MGIRAVYDPCAGLMGQLYMARYKVCMKVRLKYILDLSIVFFGTLDIRTRFTQWIYYSRFSLAFDIVSRFSQTSRIYLFYFHSSKVIRYIFKNAEIILNGS